MSSLLRASMKAKLQNLSITAELENWIHCWEELTNAINDAFTRANVAVQSIRQIRKLKKNSSDFKRDPAVDETYSLILKNYARILKSTLSAYYAPF